jgi:uncharacterized delta-60 repeat protein
MTTKQIKPRDITNSLHYRRSLFRFRKLAAMVLLFFLVTVAVRGQSALDGFDPGANGTVRALAVQGDGKVVVGRDFTTLGGGGIGTTIRNYIGRLNPDGTLDDSFNPGANANVNVLALQADSKILVGGNFSMIGGGGTGTTNRGGIARLNVDGTLDTSFVPAVGGSFLAIVVQSDGKILVGGSIGTGSFSPIRDNIARLNADGSLDMSFDPGADNPVLALAVQTDGKIVVGGQFTTLGGGLTGHTTRKRIGRLNPDGTVDTSFDPGADNEVTAVVVQPDGEILVGGDFGKLGGDATIARSRLDDLMSTERWTRVSIPA